MRLVSSPRLPLLLLGLLLAGAGCSRTATPPPPEASAEVAYWEARPAEARVESISYPGLWAAALGALERFRFEPALQDYRGGRLTSEPMVSPQFFEIWRDEIRSTSDRLESSLGTVRRRVTFRLGRSGDDRFWLEPRVVVERLSLREGRITNAIDYRRALGPGRQVGSREADAGRPLPASYWYAVGRDDVLERSLLDRIAAGSGGRLVPVPAKDAGPRAGYQGEETSSGLGG